METAEVRTAIDALRRIVRALRVSARAAEKRLGISAPQLFVLQQLGDHAGLSIGELARRTVTDQSSVSVVVSRLTTRGLAVRRTSVRDARRAEVTLTAAGRALLKKAPEAAQAQLIQGLRRLSRTHRRALTHALTCLVREMGLEDEAPQLFFADEALAVTRRSRSTPRSL
jgi:MarR family transcriptional regulator, lower aerobic nicotinate degradation pathway regulator